MSKPVVASKEPFAVEVVAGRTYWWCACGLSANQPHCDGSHKGTDMAPELYRAEASETVYFCGCKQTGNKPLCDGSHNKL